MDVHLASEWPGLSVDNTTRQWHLGDFFVFMGD
jgi:hypothetical protein